MQGDLLIIAIVTGLTCAGLTWFLDFSMHRGNILDFVRHGAAKWFAKRHNLLELFDTIPEVEEDQKASVYNQLYWNIAKEAKFLKIFICPICMSFYVFVVVGSLLIFTLTSGYTGWQIAALYFISWSTNVLTVRWIV